MESTAVTTVFKESQSTKLQETDYDENEELKNKQTRESNKRMRSPDSKFKVSIPLTIKLLIYTNLRKQTYTIANYLLIRPNQNLIIKRRFIAKHFFVVAKNE